MSLALQFAIRVIGTIRLHNPLPQPSVKDIPDRPQFEDTPVAPPPPSSATVTQPVIDSAASAPPPDHQTQPLAVVPERLPWKHTFISLTVPNFRIFAVGHFIAVIAIWMQRIAQDWMVLQLSGSVTAVGITVALQFLPSLLL